MNMINRFGRIVLELSAMAVHSLDPSVLNPHWVWKDYTLEAETPLELKKLHWNQRTFCFPLSYTA